MIDLNMLYSYAKSRRENVEEYLSAQAFTKEEEQKLTNFYEAIFVERINEAIDFEDEDVLPLDCFLIALDKMGFSFNQFCESVDKIKPNNRNLIDKMFFFLMPDNRIFDSFNEIRLKGNFSFFKEVKEPKKIPNIEEISEPNYLFKLITKFNEFDLIESSILNMIKQKYNQEILSKDESVWQLIQMEKDILLSTFYIDKNFNLRIDAPAELIEKRNDICVYFDKLFLGFEDNKYKVRDEVYKNIFNGKMGDVKWSCNEDCIDGLISIDKYGNTGYDFFDSDSRTDELIDLDEYEEDFIHDRIKKSIDNFLVLEKTKKSESLKPFSLSKIQCEQFKKEIIGQDPVINSIIDKMVGVACGFVDSEKPLISMLLNGPTGVGKTQTAKAMAKSFFDDKIYIVDMCNFKHPGDVARLTGSSPGYVGYDDKNHFIDFIKENPRAVLVFDEIDKCHPSCLSFLLSVLDEGKFISGNGEVINLSQSAIIATSNQQCNNINIKDANFNLNEMMSRSGESGSPFTKEFLGRYDLLLEYKELKKDSLKLIVNGKLFEKKKSFEQTNNGKITLNWTEDLEDAILIDSQSKVTGARALNSSIEKMFVRPISRYIVENGEIGSGEIIVDKNNKLVVNGKEVVVTKSYDETTEKQQISEPMIQYI